MSSLTISKWIVTVVSIFFLIFSVWRHLFAVTQTVVISSVIINKTVIWLVPRACKKKRLCTERLPEGAIKACLGLSELGLSCPPKSSLGDTIIQSFIDQWLDTDQVAHTPHTPIHTFLQRVFYPWELRYEIATIAPEPKISCSLILYNFLFFF